MFGHRWCSVIGQEAMLLLQCECEQMSAFNGWSGLWLCQKCIINGGIIDIRVTTYTCWYHSSLHICWYPLHTHSLFFNCIYHTILVWPVLLAQVLPRPQLIFPSKTWFFGIYLNFQQQKWIQNYYLPYSESKSYQINSI